MDAQLDRISIEQAVELQFRLVDQVHRNFPDGSFLSCGDLGMCADGRPRYTAMAERALAGFFGTEDCVLVRGAGTGAIRLSLEETTAPRQKLLIHDAPVYPTTEDTIRHMGLETVRADYNDPRSIESAVLAARPQTVLIQHARQLASDSYSLREVIAIVRKLADCVIVVDDNYAIFKDPINGTDAGADLSAFSLFKLQGPPGIGCVIGKEKYISAIRRRSRSGGTQVQGSEAMEALRGLVVAPVQLAIQGDETEKICRAVRSIIEAGDDRIRDVFIANMQSRVVMVELSKPIATQVIKYAATLGASSFPVGAESRYEIPALFYRASRTFIDANPGTADCFVRINPMRAGSETVLRILKESLNLADRDP